MMQFSRQIKIGDRTVGLGQSTYIIAEIGINHNGDMELAKRTIEAAADAGVDCVKFQSFRSEEFMADRDLIYEYENHGQKIHESMYEMFKRLEFPLDKHEEIFDFARSCGVEPLTSIADPLCMQAALTAGAKGLKLSSEDIINLPLLEVASRSSVPLILSTGMAEKEEIKDAIGMLKSNDCKDVVFLHCVSLYPTEDREANLRRMLNLGKVTSSLYGYSDHTVGAEACIAAVAMGACIIEKHFTLDRNLPGPDHKFSADPEEIKTLVDRIRRVEKMLGDGKINPVAREAAARNEFRRSIVAAEDLPAGTILAEKNLVLKRPGNGMRPKEMKNIIGKKLRKNLNSNEQITENLLEG